MSGNELHSGETLAKVIRDPIQTYPNAPLTQLNGGGPLRLRFICRALHSYPFDRESMAVEQAVALNGRGHADAVLGRRDTLVSWHTPAR